MRNRDIPARPSGRSPRPSFDAKLANRISAVIGTYRSTKRAAEVAGKSVDQLSAYRKGENEPPFTVVCRLARGAEVSVHWLATGDGPMRVGGGRLDGPSAGIAPQAEQMTTAEIEAAGYVLFPHFAIHAPPRAGLAVQSESIVDYLALKAEWIRHRLRRNPADLMVVEVIGDSMEPTIREGDVVLIDRSETHVRGNAIYALLFGNDLAVKRIQRRRDGSILVRSCNPAYSTEVVDAADVPSLHVVGRVFWIGRSL